VIDPEMERWTDQFLSLAIVEPSMTRAQIAETLPSDDRDALAVELLKLWNWLPVVDDAGKETYPNMPPDRFLAQLSICAQFYKIPAHTILRAWSFPELTFNFRVAVAARPQELHDELTERIGIERGR